MIQRIIAIFIGIVIGFVISFQEVYSFNLFEILKTNKFVISASEFLRENIRKSSGDSDY
jgi:hypothetical protein